MNAAAPFFYFFGSEFWTEVFVCLLLLLLPSLPISFCVFLAVALLLLLLLLLQPRLALSFASNLSTTIL